MCFLFVVFPLYPWMIPKMLDHVAVDPEIAMYTRMRLGFGMFVIAVWVLRVANEGDVSCIC